MEHYGLDHGIILYHTEIEGDYPDTSISAFDVHDIAYVYVNGAFVGKYDRSVPRLRQANHCIGCNQCVRHCPQSINIPAQMRRIDRFVEDLKQGREF